MVRLAEQSAFVSAQKFGGYRRNIVTYALSRLSHVTPAAPDQALDPVVEEAFEQLSHVAYGVLTDESRPARDVTEWA